MTPLLAASALAWTLFTPPADQPGEDVLLVVTPGFTRGAFQPVEQRLRQDGHRVYVLVPGCSGQDLPELVDGIRTTAASLDHPVVVAHGVGATLALLAHSPAVERYALLGPVLAPPDQELTDLLASREVGYAAHLDVPLDFHGHDAAEVLLGAPAPSLGCVPGDVARQVQGWVRTGAIPLDLEAIDAPVWLAISPGDDVCTLEAVLPAARRISGPTDIERLGLNHRDHQDFDHGDLLSEPVPLRRLARAVRRGLPRAR